MSITEMIIISVGVAMDAFAVAVSQGLSLEKNNYKSPLIIAIYFGVFQATMTLGGYFLGAEFRSFIDSFAHWVAFTILVLIGANMLIGSIKTSDTNKNGKTVTSFKVMLPLAIATSIDALAVGIGLAMVNVRIFITIIFIGGITFGLSFLGAKLGSYFGAKYSKVATITGGIILMLMGVKILLSYWGIINF